MEIALELKICLPLLLVSLVMMIVTLFETYWFSADVILVGEIRMGLWRACSGQDGCANYDGDIDWIKTPEALVSLSLICAVASLALVAFTMVRRNKVASITSAVLSLLSGVLGIAGAGVFNHKVQDGLDPDWCFYLNVAADAVMIFVAIALGIFILRASRGGRFEYIAIQR